MPRAVMCHKHWASVARTAEPGDPARTGNRQATAKNRVVQHVEQCRPVHAEPAKAFTQRLVFDVQDDPARTDLASVKPIQRLTEPAKRRPWPEPVEHLEARRLQDEARTQWPRNLELIEKLERVALPRQGKRGAEAGWAASGNGDGK